MRGIGIPFRRCLKLSDECDETFRDRLGETVIFGPEPLPD
jgi:hypothetical protein